MPPQPVQPVLTLTKKMGQTPLECMEVFRRDNPQYATVPMTYAGRLDPLATGTLIVLTGDECKNKDRYTQLDKEYELTILFGVSSDTYDVLGIPKIDASPIAPSFDRVAQALSSFVGTFTQSYPAYSSKPVNGTPLFELARNAHALGGAIQHELPAHQVTIHSITTVDDTLAEISSVELLKTVREMISTVKGDFRQEESLRAWSAGLAPATARGESFVTVRVRVHCSHGTYMRQLATDVGKELGIGALALRIHRGRVGVYKTP